MKKPMIRIHNVETGEIVDREMDDDEFAIYEFETIKNSQNKLEEQAKAEAKASAIAKLAALGLTEDEAKAIIG